MIDAKYLDYQPGFAALVARCGVCGQAIEIGSPNATVTIEQHLLAQGWFRMALKNTGDRWCCPKEAVKLEWSNMANINALARSATYMDGAGETFTFIAVYSAKSASWSVYLNGVPASDHIYSWPDLEAEVRLLIAAACREKSK